MYASGIGNAECVKVLLDGGAQINLKEEVRQIPSSSNFFMIMNLLFKLRIKVFWHFLKWCTCI